MTHFDRNTAIRALMLLPRYILMLLVFIFIGEISFMLYYDTTELMAGRHILLFSGNALLQALTIVLPACMLSAGVMLGVHRVRHSGGGLLSIIVYILLGAATWFILFPALLAMTEGIKDCQSLAKKKALTGGYFRDYGEDTVYFSHDIETENTAAVFITGYEEAGDAVSIKRISLSQMQKDAAPFSDILVKGTVPSVAKWITDGFTHFVKRARNAQKRGILSWLSFSSIGVLLFSIYALSFCSRWRLMSVVIMLSMYAGVLSFNVLYFSNMFRGMRAISLSMPIGGGSDETLLLCTNLSLAVLFVLLGVFSSLLRAREEI